MGRSKRELFLDRVLAVAGEVFDEVIVVDRAFEGAHDDEGPIFGIRAALQHAQQGRCFILAVDYPLITAEVLRYVRDRGGVPLWRGRPQPLCAVYDASLLPEIERRIARRQFEVRGLIEEELPVRFDGEPLLNVNTPQELQEAQAIDERLLASR
jgi:molybdopterin-guanine dinucleotide biosynthesis protein A